MWLVGLCGLQGAGKDAVTSVLVKKHGFQRVSFGGRVKDVVASVFGWDRGLLEGATARSREWRETPDPWWSRRLGIQEFTPRMALQIIGTDVLRTHFREDIWQASLERELLGFLESTTPAKGIVVSDCRFPHEIDLIRKLNGTLIWVQRGPLPDWVAGCVRGQPPPETVHASEAAWIFPLVSGHHHTVRNDGSLSDLGTWCDAFVTGLLEPGTSGHPDIQVKA